MGEPKLWQTTFTEILVLPNYRGCKAWTLDIGAFPIYGIRFCSKVISAPYMGHMHVDLAYIGDLSPRYWVGLGVACFVFNDSSSKLNYPTNLQVNIVNPEVL